MLSRTSSTKTNSPKFKEIVKRAWDKAVKGKKAAIEIVWYEWLHGSVQEKDGRLYLLHPTKDGKVDVELGYPTYKWNSDKDSYDFAKMPSKTGYQGSFSKFEDFLARLVNENYKYDKMDPFQSGY